MATYNGEKYIKEQIDSILSQIETDDELIVSDDGSSDETLNIISAYNDSRIKVFKHKKNRQLEKKKYSRSFYLATDNFQNSLLHAKGDYIFLSDQDDIWDKDKVTEILPFLDKYDCVTTGFRIIDEKGNVKDCLPQQKPPFSSNVIINLVRLPFLGCCLAFKKSALNYLLPFPKNLVCHDLWIGCLCARKKSMFMIDKPLHNYRCHGKNVSPMTTKKTNNPIAFRIAYRLNFLMQYYKRIILKK